MLEQASVAHLARFKYKIHYKPGKFNGQVNALSRYPAESLSEDIDLDQKDMEVVPVLPSAASLCFLKGQ